jgi:hypothetical protein
VLKAIPLSDQRPIRIFPIAYGKDANIKVLRAIADATRAKAYRGDPKTIDRVFREISTFF